jgi:hypothetical protein
MNQDRRIIVYPEYTDVDKAVKSGISEIPVVIIVIKR